MILYFPDKTPDVRSGVRTYAAIMQEQELARDKAALKKEISEKSKAGELKVS